MVICRVVILFQDVEAILTIILQEAKHRCCRPDAFARRVISVIEAD